MALVRWRPPLPELVKLLTQGWKTACAAQTPSPVSPCSRIPQRSWAALRTHPCTSTNGPHEHAGPQWQCVADEPVPEAAPKLASPCGPNVRLDSPGQRQVLPAPAQPWSCLL